MIPITFGQIKEDQIMPSSGTEVVADNSLLKYEPTMSRDYFSDERLNCKQMN